MQPGNPTPPLPSVGPGDSSDADLPEVAGRAALGLPADTVRTLKASRRAVGPGSRIDLRVRELRRRTVSRQEPRARLQGRTCAVSAAQAAALGERTSKACLPGTGCSLRRPRYASCTKGQTAGSTGGAALGVETSERNDPFVGDVLEVAVRGGRTRGKLTRVAMRRLGGVCRQREASPWSHGGKRR